MTYLEIIMIGYILNIMCLIFMVIVTLLVSFAPLFARNGLAILSNLKSAEQGQALVDDIKLIKKNLPLSQRYTGDDFALLLPFMNIPVTIRFIWYITKYGFFNGMNTLLEKKRDNLETKYLALHPEE